MSPPSSGSMNNPNKNTNMKQVTSYAGLLLGLFDHEDGGDTFL
jgi:hypothetical protein